MILGLKFTTCLQNKNNNNNNNNIINSMIISKNISFTHNDIINMIDHDDTMTHQQHKFINDKKIHTLLDNHINYFQF